MPSPRELLVYASLVTMDVLAGFTIIVGSSLLDLAGLGYSTFWLFFLAGMSGLLIGLSVGMFGPGESWNWLLLAAGAIIVIVPSLVAITNQPLTYLTGAILLGVFYWRGLAGSQDTPGFHEAQGRFGAGFGVLFLGLMLVVARGIINQGLIWRMLALAGIAYTVLAMVAMVAARTESTREPGSGQAILMAVVVQLGLLILLAFLALQLFSLDIAGGLWNLTRPMFDTLGSAGFYLITLVAKPIDWLVSLVPHTHRRITPPVTPRPIVREPTAHKQIRPHHAGNPLVVVIGLTILALTFAGVTYALYRALPRVSRRTRARGFSEERRALLSVAEIWSAFIAWLRSLSRGAIEAAAGTVLRSRRRVFGVYPADPVRRAYAQLLRRAASAGLPRPLNSTPMEYQASLVARWPDGTAHFTALTSAYERKRYGEIAFNSAQVEEIKRHWQGARGAIRIFRAPKPVADESGATPAAASALAPTTLAKWLDYVRPLPRMALVALIGERDLSLTKSILLLLLCFVTPIALTVGIIVALTTLGGH